MMFNIFKKKPAEITGKQICDIFYNMYNYYDRRCANIAVVKNKKTFELQIQDWKDKMSLKRGDKVIKMHDKRYLFMIDEQEINVVLIENIEDLHSNMIKYRRFLD